MAGIGSTYNVLISIGDPFFKYREDVKTMQIQELVAHLQSYTSFNADNKNALKNLLSLALHKMTEGSDKCDYLLSDKCIAALQTKASKKNLKGAIKKGLKGARKDAQPEDMAIVDIYKSIFEKSGINKTVQGKNILNGAMKKRTMKKRINKRKKDTSKKIFFIQKKYKAIV